MDYTIDELKTLCENNRKDLLTTTLPEEANSINKAHDIVINFLNGIQSREPVFVVCSVCNGEIPSTEGYYSQWEESEDEIREKLRCEKCYGSGKIRLDKAETM